VPGVRVVIGGQEYTTDENGIVTATGSDLSIDVEAAGYLSRMSSIGNEGNTSVTLWPVASDREAEAVRGMAFGQRSVPDLLTPLNPRDPFYVTIPSAPAEVNQAWASAAVRFGSMFNLTYVVGPVFQYETNEIEVTFGADRGCTPSPVTGFCRLPNRSYTLFAVSDDRATDPSTIDRVLASLFLGPNPLPGLLNANAPADSLSPFEIQTIRMILQRPRKTRWPDNDR
jgi:hypothetical protein